MLKAILCKCVIVAVVGVLASWAVSEARAAEVDFGRVSSAEERAAAFNAVVAAGKRGELEPLVRAMASPDAGLREQSYMQAVANIPMDYLFPLWRAALLSEEVWKSNPGRADVVRDQMLLVVRRLLHEVYWLTVQVPADGELTAADRAKVVEQVDAYLRGAAGKPAPAGSGQKVQNEKEGEPFLWVRRGKLFYLNPNLPYNGVRREPLAYVYRDMEGVMSVVSLDLGNIATMVRTELGGPAAVEVFLKSGEAREVFRSLLAVPGEDFLDDGNIRSRAKLPPEIWGEAYSRKRLQRSTAILSQYADKGVSLQGEKWKWVLHALTDSGSIEQWSLHGMTWPFSIDGFEKRMVEKPGTIEMPAYTF